MAGERAVHVVRGHEPRGRVAVHELPQLARDVCVERRHDLEPRGPPTEIRVRLALAVGGEQADLRHLAAEVVERERQQPGDAGSGAGGARQRAARLVQEREVGGLAALGEVGAVGEEDRQHGREQQDDRPRVRRTTVASASPRLVLMTATQVDITTIEASLRGSMRSPESHIAALTSSTEATTASSTATVAASQTCGPRAGCSPATMWKTGGRSQP